MSKPSSAIRKVLVANRGEIASRVFRTCRSRGLATVAVFSDADAGALYVSEADEAVHIGPTPSAESYLRVDKIIAAAKATGADAIHPGYGFLSERPELVAACEAEGIIFVGPAAEAMRAMGDKVRARQAMIAAGVPVVPGREDLKDADDALVAAQEIGYPLMLKASAGGGGKGMRIVHDEASLRRGFEAASREAVAAFGDGRMFVERAVMRARHVEIQLMADAHGEVVYLNERDCSVQRRHQKVIEEAPCPSAQMSPEVRRAMGEVAVKAARAVDYVGAGTVEFLFEEGEDGPQFYFLEMNTRLQVEHPVTEAITGLDLVWDQIRVAAGEPLGYKQSDVALWGHALECRIYAEDPIRFLPSPGVITRLVWPRGTSVRVDAAVGEGSEVSSHYDPMIAKITVWGRDRTSAIAAMRDALKQTVILGIETNIPFHLRVLEDPDFASGAFSTRYIEEHPDLLGKHEISEVHSRALAAAAALASSGCAGGGMLGSSANTRQSASRADGRTSGHSEWRRALRWRQ